MLHEILSCSENLHKWKIRNIAVYVMYVTKIKQLFICFFDCKHVERLWTSVGEALGMSITQDSIMCGCMDGNLYGNNIVIILVCFFYIQRLARSFFR